jgi:Flp pilus assembly protein TadD
MEVRMRLVLPTLTLAASALALGGCGPSGVSQPREAQITLHVADAAMAAGAPDMALRVAEMVLQKQPDNVAAMVARADALYALGAPDQARAAYRLAVATDPTDPGAEIGLGRTLVRSDPHAAEAAFMAALAKQPDNVLALNDLGIARDMLGHHEAAQTAYRMALAVVPDNADVQTNLGLSLALSGDRAKAVLMLQPVASAPDATDMQRANLAMAMTPDGSTGLVESTGPISQGRAERIAAVQEDPPPVAISVAPVAAVRRQDLAAQPVVRAVVAQTGSSVSGPHVDASAVVADAGTIVRISPTPIIARDAVVPGIARDETLPPAMVPAPPPVMIAAQSGSTIAAPPTAVAAAPASASGSIEPVAARVIAALEPALKAAEPGSSTVKAADAPATVPAQSGQATAPAVRDDRPASAPVPAPVAEIPVPTPAPAPRMVIASLEPDAKAALPAPVVHQPAGITTTGFFVQIGAVDTARAAHAEWRKMRARLPNLFASHTPTVQLAHQHDKPFWRLRTGSFASLAEANDFCAKLRAAGSRCWTVGAARGRRQAPS